MEITDRSVTVGKLEDPNTISAEQAALNSVGTGGVAPQEDRDFNAALARRALLPMEKMFAVENDSETARQALGGTWAKQCYAFVHWGLYGEQGRHQQAFVTFIRRLNQEPVSEALFKECFKKSYGDMELALRGYVEFTSHNVAGVAAAKGQKLPEPPPFELRDATDSEVGRIKGDTLRLAGHEAAAHLALIAPYIRGERDPQLLAALGLQERAAGDLPRARKFLEAAARASAVRPRAYLELARLRFADAAAHPAAGHAFSAAQTVEILKALFTARSQPPPLPEVYEAIGEAWSRCVLTPTAGHLGVLDEGVRLFPRDAALIERTAELKVKAGLATEAAALIDLGLRVAPVGPAREKFEALKAALPKPAVAPAK
jgi:tetratricopeptide (TPR) repeat protein